MSEERELSDEMKSANKLVEAINKLNEVNRDTVFREELEKRWPKFKEYLDINAESGIFFGIGFHSALIKYGDWLKQKLLEKK